MGGNAVTAATVMAAEVGVAMIVLVAMVTLPVVVAVETAIEVVAAVVIALLVAAVDPIIMPLDQRPIVAVRVRQNKH
jgi:hypothetical protein